MEIQFSPQKDLNLIQRNNLILKKIKVRSKRQLKYENNKELIKLNRSCKKVIF